jgi:Bacterial protein of unknown function (DUF885)
MAGEVDRYVEAYYAFHPHAAIWDGRHEHDGQVPDFSSAAIGRRVAELDRWGVRLGAASDSADRASSPQAECQRPPLESQARRDVALAAYAHAFELFRWRDWRPYERNPGFYHGALDVSIYVKRAYAPAGARLEALTRHLRGVRDVLAAARGNLVAPLSRPAVEHAIHTYTGLADYYDQQLRAAGVALAGNETSAKAFQAALHVAIGAVREFVAFLREHLANPGGDFRLGPQLLGGLLRYGELADMPLDRLRAAAMADLERNHARLDEVAGTMGLRTAAAVATLGQMPVPEEQVLAVAASAMDELRAFLEASGIFGMALARATPCRVVETPPFMRAGSAFMDVPGPFESPGLPAYFYVTLPDPAWPAAAREAWLAKLNPWGLSNTAAHEAFPGHLLHFLHVAQVPSAAARAFMSYACIEGWAHYAEQVPIEAGYAAADPRAQLAQLVMALLRDCRCLVALDVHAGDASLQEAADFIAAHTHLAPIRCRQEAHRGAQDPGYLLYTLGKLMLLELRAAFARQEGSRYSLRRFHDAFLGCGAPPLPLARRMLLDDPGGELV